VGGAGRLVLKGCEGGGLTAGAAAAGGGGATKRVTVGSVGWVRGGRGCMGWLHGFVEVCMRVCMRGDSMQHKPQLPMRCSCTCPC